jgi:hypothetical protein
LPWRRIEFDIVLGSDLVDDGEILVIQNSPARKPDERDTEREHAMSLSDEQLGILNDSPFPGVGPIRNFASMCRNREPE